MVPWHMGAMHPFEQILTLILAFGPFLVLGIVVVVRRRMDRLEEERERQNAVWEIHRLTGESPRPRQRDR